MDRLERRIFWSREQECWICEVSDYGVFASGKTCQEAIENSCKELVEHMTNPYVFSELFPPESSDGGWENYHIFQSFEMLAGAILCAEIGSRVKVTDRREVIVKMDANLAIRAMRDLGITGEEIERGIIETVKMHVRGIK